MLVFTELVVMAGQGITSGVALLFVVVMQGVCCVIPSAKVQPLFPPESVFPLLLSCVLEYVRPLTPNRRDCS